LPVIALPALPAISLPVMARLAIARPAIRRARWRNPPAKQIFLVHFNEKDE
jgi:hypothetical protein